MCCSSRLNDVNITFDLSRAKESDGKRSIGSLDGNYSESHSSCVQNKQRMTATLNIPI